MTQTQTAVINVTLQLRRDHFISASKNSNRCSVALKECAHFKSAQAVSALSLREKQPQYTDAKAKAFFCLFTGGKQSGFGGGRGRVR